MGGATSKESENRYYWLLSPMVFDGESKLVPAPEAS